VGLKRCGGGIPFMKEKTQPKTKERKALQAPCCYTHLPPPTKLTANTITAGCPGSLGARFGHRTSREHLPVRLQSRSALAQQPGCSGKLHRWLSHAKLLNNLWGKFPLQQNHTVQLTRRLSLLESREGWSHLHAHTIHSVFLAVKRAAASQQ